MIPHIIHQSWKTKQIPASLREFQNSWHIHHPNWECRLWTDEDNQRLIDDEYPQFAAFYRQLPIPVLKIDFVRLAYLHRFGGLYVDLDFEALRGLDPLLNESRIVVGRETGGIGNAMRGSDFILNALIASPCGHPVWLEVMQQMAATFRPRRLLEPKAFYVIRMTVQIFDQVMEAYQKNHDDITIHPHEVFYPASPAERLVATRRALARSCGAFAIHHYENTWFGRWNKLINAALRRWQLWKALRQG